MTKKIPNDKRHLKYGSAFSIKDIETYKILQKPIDLKVLQDDYINDNFLIEYDRWIKATKGNSIIGLDNFQYRCYSNGTTESFDKFYLKNKGRRFRCFKGEYMYHMLAWRNYFDWKYIEDDKLDSNDAVIISLPFADTGDVHSLYENTMDACSKLLIPVLIDCAYFGICSGIVFNLDYPCITDVTFSLSKTFPVAHARVGMRYTKMDNDDTLFVYQKINYINKLGANLGLNFIEKFHSDYIPNRYKKIQIEICKELGVIPSKTVLFGIGDHKWNEYNRGTSSNRLSFHRQLGDFYASSES